MSYEISKPIMNDCKAFPRIATSLAEKSCAYYANKHLKTVGKTVMDENGLKKINKRQQLEKKNLSFIKYT